MESQWREINKSLNFYKILLLVTSCSVVVCLIIALGQAFARPTVVLKDKAAHCFVEAEKASIEMTDGDISQFVKNWVIERYEWKKLNEAELIQSLMPFTSDGLLEKIKTQFAKGPEKEFVAKGVSQYVPEKSIAVTLADDHVTVSFDRILRVSGVPVIDPAQMSLTLVKGTKSRINPYGIYVNGITEYSSGR